MGEILGKAGYLGLLGFDYDGKSEERASSPCAACASSAGWPPRVHSGCDRPTDRLDRPTDRPTDRSTCVLRFTARRLARALLFGLKFRPRISTQPFYYNWERTTFSKNTSLPCPHFLYTSPYPAWAFPSSGFSPFVFILSPPAFQLTLECLSIVYKHYEQVFRFYLAYKTFFEEYFIYPWFMSIPYSLRNSEDSPLLIL